MDINSIINKSVDGYLKPKYPIYRVKYFKACLIWEVEGGEDHKLESDYCERICELKEDDDAWNNYFEENENVIFERLIDRMVKMRHKTWKVIDNEYENIIVIGLEQLA